MKADLNNWKTIVLCEDTAHYHFIRNYLKLLGAKTRNIHLYPNAYSSDKAYNNATVLKYYPKAVNYYRTQALKENILLVVMIDADDDSLSKKINLFSTKLTEYTPYLSKRKPEENIFIFAPKRNIESWFYYIDTLEDINETKNYKKGKYKNIKASGIINLAEKLYQTICSTNNIPANIPSSLQDACDEMDRNFKYEENSVTEQQDLLFELGCEELPPKNLLTLSNALLNNMLKGLDDAGLSYQDSKAYATPRRLAVLIKGLNAAQADKVVEKRGPAVKAAFAEDGSPSRAALGFAKSCGAEFDALDRMKTDKGEWLVFNQAVKGKATTELVPEIINKSIRTLPIAKKMRWGNSSIEFVRPVHWAVLLYGENVIETEVLGLKTGNQSRGHRFHAPDAISIQSPETYVETLRSQGQVEADFTARKDVIRQAANEAAAKVGGLAHIEEDLLEEIAALNEQPIPVMGNFDERFLNLPKEVLITTMQSNQKYFPVVNETGDLLAHFITFSNIKSTRPESIQHGNERVILPRLADAEFFWNQDRKQTLSDRVEKLQTIVFQQKLGTLADKTTRLQTLANYIANEINADSELAQTAAHLAKTDLITDMVGEFASLQGIMGRYYALADGEMEEVAQALEEQYFPKQSGTATPSSTTGQILSLADKVDTLTGIFSAGLIPTGDKDPYALRRAALGILRIIIENKLVLNLVDLISYALQQYSHDFDRGKTKALVTDFVFERLKGYCLEQGYSHDEFEAVIAIKPEHPLDFMARLQAVKHFRTLAEAESLAAANKRISNILKKSETKPAESVGHLIESEERRLQGLAEKSAKEIEPLLAQGDYETALSHLAQLKEPVDNFFDNVMVNCEDLDLRANRLALLNLLSKQFLQIADISKLQS